MILLGESGAGKSCLFHRIIYNQYRDGGTYEKKTFTTPTGLSNVHYENHTKEVVLSGNIRVNVCDTTYTMSCIIYGVIEFYMECCIITGESV